MIGKALLLLSAFACLIYALIKYAGRKVALFPILVSGAIGCFFLGYLYDVVIEYISGGVNGVFNVGMLADIGGFGFIFSASFAQIDGLGDDKSRALSKYRITAVLAPLLIMAMYLPVFLSDNIENAEKFTGFVILIFAALSSYFNFKHLIIPDVSYGIINSIRLYNLFSLLGTAVFCAMTVTEKLGFEVASTVLAIVLALIYPCIMLTMEGGRKKWIS